MSDKNNELQNKYWNLKPECEIAIRNYLNKGEDFSSPLMESTYTIKASDSLVDGIRAGTLFHYTRHVEVSEAIQAQNYDSIFSFVHKIRDHFLYVAADSYSSSTMGYYKVSFKLKDGAKIYTSASAASNLKDGGAGHASGTSDGDVAVEKEQLLKDPTLSVCTGAGNIGGVSIHPLLVLLAAEANHIDLIAYYGVAHFWYQMLDTWAIESSSVEELPH